MNPFKWFNDLIERSALWYAVYVIALKYFFAHFFGARSDEFMYTFSIIFWTVITYVAFKFVLKKLEKYLRYYEQYNFILNLFFIFVVPILIFFALIYHPLLGTFISMIIAFIGCFALKITDKYNAKKQA